jgi:hypothetical protein
MSAIVLSTSGLLLVVMECSSIGDRDRLLLDRDIGVAPVVLRRCRKPGASLPPRQRRALLCDLGVGHDMYDELFCSQARADLEVRLVHYDFFLDERLRGEVVRRVLLDADPRLVFLLLDRVEPTFEPRFVLRVRRLGELPEPDPDPDPLSSAPAAAPAAGWAPC